MRLLPEIVDNTCDLVEKLLQQLTVYALDLLNEDVFKGLYEELVDPEVRHDLGEYYTPDWLAEYVVRDLIKENPTASILDPACGSGTFLFSSVKYITQILKKQDKSDEEILKHLQRNLCGIDVHPLAVIIARTNYLLALKDLLEHRRGVIRIPVYLGDSLRLPDVSMELQHRVDVFRLPTGSKYDFFIPLKIAKSSLVLDGLMDKMYEFAKKYRENKQKMSKKAIVNAFFRSIQRLYKGIKEQEFNILKLNMENMLKLIDLDKNSIWVYILKNIYKPFTLSHKKFDFIVGNPPWLAIRYLKDKDYQKFLKDETFTYNLIDKSSTHQLPNLELATLFLCHSVDKYLKVGGTLVFVMPKSVLVASHHLNFRKFNKPAMQLETVVDLEDVTPLFNVPACVLKIKKGKSKK